MKLLALWDPPRGEQCFEKLIEEAKTQVALKEAVARGRTFCQTPARTYPFPFSDILIGSAVSFSRKATPFTYKKCAKRATSDR